MGDEYSRQILEDLGGRVLQLVGAIGTNANIRALMASAGYTADDHAEGWAKLHRSQGYQAVPASPPAEDKKVHDALAEIDNWDEPNFRRHKAALVRLHPAQADFLFNDLASSKGIAAVAGVKRFLDRVDVLENDPQGVRASTRDADRAAVATLVKRRLTPAVRAHLRELIGIVEKGTPEGALPISDEERHLALIDLKHWYDDWAETAHTIVKRRDYLIRMGLASRRRDPGTDGGTDAGGGTAGGSSGGTGGGSPA
jgi:hypothetical protein